MTSWMPRPSRIQSNSQRPSVLQAGSSRGQKSISRSQAPTNDGDLRGRDRTAAVGAVRARQRDVDCQAGVVYVRRAFANGRIKHTKTRLSTRAVPLQAKALEALDRLPASDNPILFPNARGGRIDFRIFGRKHWRPAQIKAGIDPVRGLYDLRDTYATFALRAGVPVFAVSRFMGTTIAMIDRHYGHLANDSREHAVALLDALAFERAVDAARCRERL
jgi:hypothetical protein